MSTPAEQDKFAAKTANLITEHEKQWTDPVNHPPHYTHGIEAMDAIESWGLNYALGNVIKYVCRCDHKGTPIIDLEKAAWYLQREIERRKRTSNG